MNETSSDPQLILASQSPQRQSLFSTLNVPFTAIPADLDEKAIVGETQEERAEKIARAKAEMVAKQYPHSIVVAADTYLIFNGQAFEKPASISEAREMLTACSGQSLREVTGVCYIDPAQNLNHSEVVIVKLQFRHLSAAEIDHYVTTQPVTTWSGAFCPAYVEGAALIASIDGSFTGFTHGLPLDVIVPLLRQSGQIR